MNTSMDFRTNFQQIVLFPTILLDWYRHDNEFEWFDIKIVFLFWRINISVI